MFFKKFQASKIRRSRAKFELHSKLIYSTSPEKTHRLILAYSHALMKRPRSPTTPLSSSSAVTNGATRMQQLVESRKEARRALTSSMTWAKGRPNAQHSGKQSVSAAELQALIRQIHDEWHKRTLSALHQFLDSVVNIIKHSVSFSGSRILESTLTLHIVLHSLHVALLHALHFLSH